MRRIYALLAGIALSTIGGCTIMDGNAIVTGTTRAPISPDQVRLYRAPPDRFEEVAIVNASAGHDFRKDSSLMNAAIERLKQEAAKVGANGVLLSGVNERDAPSVSTTYGSATATGGGTSVYASGSGTSVNRGDAYTRVRGIAIYVP
jgi:hypothetical protein